MAKKLTSAKARKILHDKEVHGKPLTEKQRKFFGAIAGGAEPYKAQIGTMLTALPSNMMDRLSDALAFPQKAVTKMVTGKYQTPSEAMGITSPIGAIATDAFLDPFNLFGGAGAARAAGALDNLYKINPMARKTPAFSNLPRAGEMIRHPFQNKMVPIEEVSGNVERFYPKNVEAGGPGYSAARGSKEWKELSESGRFDLMGKEKGTHAMIDLVTDVEKRKLAIPTSDLAKYRLETNVQGVPNWLMGYPKAPKKQDGGWLDKYDEGGVLKQKKEDNYGVQGNYNNYDISLPDGFKGWAYNLKGRNYSPAWGGQFQMGGSLPGATGFMYARTINPAPSNGPYAKKTKASAQNGQEMKYYQEGLDFKPKTISQDGSAITTDINDYRRWQDSVRNYIRGQKDLAKARADVKKNLSNFSLMSSSGLVGAFSNLIHGDYQGKRRFLPKYTEQSLPRQYWGPLQYPQVPKDVIVVGDPGFDTSRKIKGLTEALEENKNLTETNVLPYSAAVEIYHPPVRKSLKYQPPVKKQQTSKTTGPLPIIETPRRGKYVPIPKEEIDLGYELPVPNAPSPLKASQFENKPTKYTFTYPTGKYNEQKTIYFPTRSAWKSYVEGIKGTEKFKGSQEGVDYASATGYLQDGGDIPVDSMGYWNPENVGGPVIIPSNVITMEGVDQPLLGISDTGDVQYMEPGEDYEFDGEYVTEYPVAKKGISVNNADAQPLKKLDQLFNFTNYNKPTKGGWLDKYN